jgi:hypothetical protein
LSTTRQKISQVFELIEGIFNFFSRRLGSE